MTGYLQNVELIKMLSWLSISSGRCCCCCFLLYEWECGVCVSHVHESVSFGISQNSIERFAMTLLIEDGS